MNLSFAGCGFLSIYHVGVAICFKRYTPHLLLDKLSGASAGAIAACCLLCDLPLGTMTSNVLKVVKEARKKALGPFSPSFNVQAILLESLQKYLPDDAHIRVNGKLHISLTRVYDGKNVIVSQFNSKEDLLQALLASSFIPLFSGLLPPRFHGIRYMDGGFSDNLPTLDENTITISPFCGESDICPRDLSSQLFHVHLANTSIELSRQNIYRFARILFPPNPETLSNMCKQGFEDALRFLHRNNLINCDRCLAVQSTFIVSESIDENNVYDPECDECKVHRQEALVANLPETVMSIFQDAIDSANKGIINWLFKHKSMKLLSLLSLPYTLPADIVYASFTKFIVNTPKLQSHLLELVRKFLQQLSLLFPKINVYYSPLTQTIKCQVEITDFSLGNDYNIKKLNDSNNCNAQWNDSDFVIKIADYETHSDDTFDNIMQVSSDQEALVAYYYMDKDNKIHVGEIFDVAQSSETNEIKNCHYNEMSWDDPRWLDQHTLTNVTNQNNTYNIGDHFHYVDHSNQHTNVFSDPESDWHMEKHTDSRPEVDQPVIN